MEWQSNLDLSAGFSYSVAETCPACGGTGTLEGDDDSNRSYEYEPSGDPHDPVWVTATVAVPTDYFSCPTCHLVLDTYELIEQAGLPAGFTAVEDDPPPEQEYGND